MIINEIVIHALYTRRFFLLLHLNTTTRDSLVYTGSERSESGKKKI